MLSVQSYGNHICGGVMLSNSAALTAAHCIVNGSQPSRYSVMVRRVSLGYGNNHPDCAQRLPVQEYFLHPSFDAVNYTSDLAVLRLRPYDCHVPIAFPRLDCAIGLDSSCDPSAHDREVATTLGWGMTAYDASKPADQRASDPSYNQLQSVELQVWPNDDCVSVYRWYSPGLNLCAGDAEGGRDACEGDSGGPLYSRNASAAGEEEVTLLIGLTSTGDGCGLIGKPGVYTRIGAFHEWIMTTAGLDPPPPPPSPAPPSPKAPPPIPPLSPPPPSSPPMPSRPPPRPASPPPSLQRPTAPPPTQSSTSRILGVPSSVTSTPRSLPYPYLSPHPDSSPHLYSSPSPQVMLPTLAFMIPIICACIIHLIRRRQHSSHTASPTTSPTASRTTSRTASRPSSCPSGCTSSRASYSS